MAMKSTKRLTSSPKLFKTTVKSCLVFNSSKKLPIRSSVAVKTSQHAESTPSALLESQKNSPSFVHSINSNHLLLESLPSDRAWHYFCILAGRPVENIGNIETLEHRKNSKSLEDQNGATLTPTETQVESLSNTAVETAVKLKTSHLHLLTLPTFTAFLSSLSTSPDPSHTMTLYTNLKRNGHTPTAFHRSRLLLAYPSQYDPIFTTTLRDYTAANSSVKSTLITNTFVQQLLTCLLNDKHAKKDTLSQRADEYWSSLTQTSLNFTPATYLAFLAVFAHLKMEGMAETVHYQLSKTPQSEWPRDTFYALSDAHYKLGHEKAVKRVVEGYENVFGKLGNSRRSSFFPATSKATTLESSGSSDSPSLTKMVSQYIWALNKSGNHEYLAVILDKISRLDSERATSILYDLGYASLWDSLKHTGNTSMAQTFLRVMRAHHKSGGVKYTTLYHALQFFEQHGSLVDMRNVFWWVVNSRSQMVLKRNAECGLDFSVHQMTNLFVESIASSSTDRFLNPVLNTGRDNWTCPLTPTPILSLMVSFLARTRDAESISNFFKEQVFPALIYTWSKSISGNLKHLHNMRLLAQSQIDEIHERSLKVLFVGGKSLKTADLKTTLTWCKRREKRGMVLYAGENGPLAAIYKHLIRAWREAGQDDNPLVLDELLRELEKQELEIVNSSEIRKYLQVRKSDVENVASQDDLEDMPAVFDEEVEKLEMYA